MPVLVGRLVLNLGHFPGFHGVPSMHSEIKPEPVSKFLLILVLKIFQKESLPERCLTKHSFV